MKVLVIGSGGREHAMVDALAESSKITKIIAAPGNGGMADQAELLSNAADDIGGLSNYARNERIDLTVVGPEVPLSMGIVDAFRRNELPILGPAADHARLESSKSFAKQFFSANKIPTASFVEC